MLIVSRKKNDSLVINEEIIVTVVELRKDKVLLGVVAPRDARIHRHEVFDAIHGRPAANAPENAAALAGPPAEPLANRREAWLDRVAAALQVKTGVPVSRTLLEQVFQDAGVPELGADPAG
jgi:carbon storage regulator